MSDDLDWNKGKENYDNRLKKEKEASKRKNKKSKVNPPRARFVQGGQTGMVQQNLKNYPHPCPKGMGMIEYIHETMTETYKMDIVLIHWGFRIRAINNCAEYFAKLKGSKPFVVRGGYKCWNIGPKAFLPKLQKQLLDANKEFCFAEQTEVINGKCTERTITLCTNKQYENNIVFYD
tara:strand:+ start:400 stop:930 length:531 start_codon:yes stop_codon:yes gene_type:complete